MTPPPAMAAAEMMTPAGARPDSQANRDILRVMEHTTLGWWALVAITFLILHAAVGVVFDQPYRRVGPELAVAILTDPWGTTIELSEGLAD